MKSGDAVMAAGTPTSTNSTQVPPEERLFELLGEAGAITIATAESCTGGNVAARLTSVSGSSAYVLGGIVSYSNDAKASLLGVPQRILDTDGAVSAACALAMADGARRAFGAEMAVATTGIAGPTGATDRKPVGLVYIALSVGDHASVEEHHFSGDRAAVTAAATERALRLLVWGAEETLGIDHARHA
jgi:nicotinamide-nucleotide amidase